MNVSASGATTSSPYRHGGSAVVATHGLALMGNCSPIPASLRACLASGATVSHPFMNAYRSLTLSSVATVAGHSEMLSKPIDTYDTDYLWALLFSYVDMQVELQRLGKLRDAVIIRRRCRAIGMELRKRYELCH